MMSKLAARRTLVLALIALGMSGAAFAATPPAAPSTGLGQAWPAATDVSMSTNYHAYVFVLGGIQYIQINDISGNVLGAVGTAGGQYITLPIGKFAQLVSTPQQPATTSATPAASSSTVYNDGTTAVTATPMSDGTTTLKAMSAAACNDPAICSTQGAQ
jgi:hypothetical protein